MTTTEAVRQSPAAAPARPRPPQTGFGQLLLRLHFYAGIFVAPFLLVAALTGLAYTITPQLERFVYHDELVVASTNGTPKPLTDQIAAARAAVPDGTPVTLRPGSGAATTQIDFAVPTLDEEHRRTVYVDPYTAQVTGELTTWFATTPVRTWFDDLHRNLHLGVAGRYYSEFAASWLAVLTLGGLALWWRRVRSVRRLAVPDLAARKGVRRTRGFHASLGVWLTVGMLFLSVTGLTWSRFAGGNFSAALDAIRGGTPSLSTTIEGPAPAATGGHHGGGVSTPAPPAPADAAAADRVLAIARSNGLSGPVEMGVPADSATAWSVAQIDQTAPLRLDKIAIDGATGKIVDRSDFADWPLGAQLSKIGISAHMGNLLGVANQVLLALLAIGLICVIVWGYRMWWQRRPTRADRKALVGTPLGERGAWQKLPAWAVVAGVPIVLFGAWAVPLFGVPLAAFLLVDVAAGALGRRRSRRAVPVSPAP
nr:PepSY domain-containing protein [uncultured Actinoplanes sp.]